MRTVWACAAGLLFLAPLFLSSGHAQQAPDQAQPLPPLQQQWQQEGVPPSEGVPPTQESPASPDPSEQGDGGSTQAPDSNKPAASPIARPNTWLPARVVKLKALDKVNAQAAALTIKVGQSATFGSLTITAKACLTRPADQPADAAAYLAVVDGHPDSPGFDGWMLADEPSVSMMEHPIYDLRVIGCA